jgi:hypothetical protein
MSTGKDQDTRDTADDNPGNGGNPDNGNCGNDGSNGNAQHCGGSTETSPPGPSTTKTTTETSTSTQTTTSRTTTSRTTSTETTTSKTTPTETSETTTSTSTTGPGLPAPGGGGGGAPEVPAGPAVPPQIQLPPKLMPPATEPVEPTVIDVAPGVAVAAAEFPIAPITLPIIVAPATGLGGGAAGAPRAPTLPGTPRGGTAEAPAGREPLPASVGSNVAVPASSYRIGYTEYLRSAGLSQVAVLAVAGVAGMLVLTGAGGLVGFRQAKAGHAVHTNTARFLN